MQHDGEAGQFLLDGLKHVESQRRRHEATCGGVNGALLGGEFVSAVRGTDADGQRVHAGFGHEVDDFLGLGVVAFGSGDFVFHAGQHAEFAFYGYIKLMGVVDDLFREGHILVVRQGGAVDHHRRKAHVDAALAGLKAVAVVECSATGSGWHSCARLSTLAG